MSRPRGPAPATLLGALALAVASALAGALALVLAVAAPAEVIQSHHVRISLSGELRPKLLPRRGTVPITVGVAAKISGTGGAEPPQLRRMTIAINANGHLEPGGLPRCRLDQIQPATTEGALEACRGSLVGRGSFSARILLPEQAPFPSAGEVYAFNGTYRGHPAILAHVYGTEPAPTSFTLPFQITRTKGTFGTLLSASLPQVTSQWGYVTGLDLTLGRTFSSHGARRSYLSAGCPAPKGFQQALFPLVRADFAFAGAAKLSSTINRSCRVRP